MNNVTMDTVLAQMRALSDAAGPASAAKPTAGVEGIEGIEGIEGTVGKEGPEFSRLFKDSLDQVNNLQSNARELKTAFEIGDDSVSMPEVMVAVQKASISFEAVTQVRNRLLSAYQEIMNMQV